jgi:hypothetical protein
MKDYCLPGLEVGSKALPHRGCAGPIPKRKGPTLSLAAQANPAAKKGLESQAGFGPVGQSNLALRGMPPATLHQRPTAARQLG